MAAVPLLAGCGDPGGTAGLELVDWPGRSGRGVVLDQPLVVEFDRPLDPRIRAGAFRLETLERQPVDLESWEVSGRLLLLQPRIPLEPDLSDGSLRPGTRYQLLLRGVPHLNAITSPEDAALVGDRAIHFTTLDVGDPDALAGEGAVREPLRVQLPLQGPNLQAGVEPDGKVRIPVSAGIDPRSLQEPARLLLGQERVAREVPLRLEENLPRRAVLLAEVGPLEGFAELELPRALEGLGGGRLLEQERRIRLVAP